MRRQEMTLWEGSRCLTRMIRRDSATRTLLLAWLALLCLAGLVTKVQAQVAPYFGSDPVLRIETGSHTEPIRAITQSSDGRFILTGAEDKTVRVWEAQAGRLVRTLRPPLHPGEGQVQALALTEDNGTLAVGGQMRDGKGFRIWLFDRATGELKRSIKGLAGPANALAFMSGSQRLVAGLAEGGPLRVFELSSPDVGEVTPSQSLPLEGILVGLVPTREGGLYLVTRAPNRLLWFAQVKDVPTRVLALPSTLEPTSLALSADEKMLAIGTRSGGTVLKIPAALGDIAYLTATQVSEDAFTQVAFTAEGRLCAGGSYRVRGHSTLRCWRDEGAGEGTDVDLSQGPVSALTRLGSGFVAYGTESGSMGVADPDGREHFAQASARASYRAPQDILISPDARTVSFYLGNRILDMVTFSLETRSYSRFRPPGLSRASTSSNGLTLSDCSGKRFTLQGQPISLGGSECIALAVSSDGKGAFVATDGELRRFEPSGKERWSVPVRGGVQSVNVSQDGQTLVIGTGDGTLRWLRAEDGRELLALYPHLDGRRWILFTPDGRYDGSSGGESLLGWHLNRGADQAATLLPSEVFQSARHQPGELDQVIRTFELQGLPPLPALDSGLIPPALQLLTPVDGQAVSFSGFDLILALSDPQLMPERVSLVDDGVPYRIGKESWSSSLSSDGKRRLFRFPLALSPGEHFLSISLQLDTNRTVRQTAFVRVTAGTQANAGASTAEAGSATGTEPLTTGGTGQTSAHNSASSRNLLGSMPAARGTEPQTTVITERGLTQAGAASLWVLAVGVSRYESGDIGALTYADDDAQAFAQALSKQRGRFYRNVTVRELVDEKATRTAVMDGLNWLKSNVDPQDVAVIFLAGHGVNDASGRYRFLPVDAHPDAADSSTVSGDEIRAITEQLPGKTLLFIDSCHSGNVMKRGERGMKPVNANQMLSELADEGSIVVAFSASTGRQSSLESAEWGHGAFTRALLDALAGGADLQNKGTISYKELDLFLSKRVEDMTRGQQASTSYHLPIDLPDFDIAGALIPPVPRLPSPQKVAPEKVGKVTALVLGGVSLGLAGLAIRDQWYLSQYPSLANADAFKTARNLAIGGSVLTAAGAGLGVSVGWRIPSGLYARESGRTGQASLARQPTPVLQVGLEGRW